MSYGTLAVDYITYTSDNLPTNITVSSIINGNFPSVTTTGSVSGAVVLSASGRFDTVTGVSGAFITVTGTSGLFETVTGVSGRFTSVTGVSGSFTTVTGTTGLFTTATSTSGVFTTVTGASGSFTTGLITVLGVGQTSPSANANLDLSGSYVNNVSAVNALNIDCSSGNYFTKTISSGSTFTVSNVPSGRVYSFTLELTHTAGAITWFSGVEWPGGSPATLTSGKTHLFMFVTDDNGARWRASSLINYTN